MKKLIIAMACGCLTAIAVQAQWNPATTSTTADLYRDGNVGVALNSAPQTKFDIGNSQGTGMQFRYDNSLNYRIRLSPYWNSNSDTRLDFNIERAAGGGFTTVMSVGYNNYVGIGTTTPSENLAVKRALDGNIASFNGSNSGLILQSNASTFDIVGYMAVAGYKPLFLRSGANGLFVNTTGQIGIGTLGPIAKLDINGSGNGIINSSNKIIDSDYGDMLSITSAVKGSTINLVSTRTDVGPLGGILFTTTQGYADSHRNIAGIVGGRVSTDVTAGGYLGFWTKNGQGDIPREGMRLTQEGNVGIGTTTPDAKLTVKGVIHTQELNIDMNGAMVPDYVFEKSYDLKPIDEVENYITANKHLPEIPSAKEMEASGMDVKALNLALLKKIEELTLYIIDLKKENEKQNAEIEALRKQKDTN